MQLVGNWPLRLQRYLSKSTTLNGWGGDSLRDSFQVYCELIELLRPIEEVHPYALTEWGKEERDEKTEWEEGRRHNLRLIVA